MNWLRTFLCKHRWTLIDKFAIHRNLDGKQCGTLFVSRCDACGAIQRKRVSP